MKYVYTYILCVSLNKLLTVNSIWTRGISLGKPRFKLLHIIFITQEKIIIKYVFIK